MAERVGDGEEFGKCEKRARFPLESVISQRDEMTRAEAEPEEAEVGRRT